MSIVQKQFNQAAHTYDQHAFIQKMMANQLLRFAKVAPSKYASILDVGCGTGILTQLLHQAFPHTSITAMDIADNMLHAAQEKVCAPNVQFFQQDMESDNWKVTSRYDLIISNAVFQWINNPHQALTHLISQLQNDGRILISTFGPNTFCELTSLFEETEKKMRIPSYPHHLPMRDATYWRDLTQNFPLYNVKTTEETKKIHYPCCLDFLRSIKAIGASSGRNNHSLLVQKKLLQTVIKEYDLRYRSDDSVYATYHVIYIQGQLAM